MYTLSLRLLLNLVVLFFAYGQLAAVEPQIAHGYYHTLYLASDGTVWSVGSNSNGQLGDGTTTSRTVPVKVNLTGVDGDVVEIAAGAFHSVLRTSKSLVYCWGSNSDGQCCQPKTTTQFTLPTISNAGVWARSIDAGYAHTLLGLHEGGMYAFGDNNYGQLGNNNPGVDAESIVYVSISGEEVMEVSAGRYFSMALCASGKVYTWGQNNYYQLGLGDTLQRNAPVLMTALSDVKKISAGGYHAMALTKNGYAYSWGRNLEAQCNPTAANYQTTPYLSRAACEDVAASLYNSYAIYTTGQVYAWGRNSNGECGDGTTTTPVTTTFAVIGASNVTKLPQDINYLSCSSLHADGSVKSWGYNIYEMLNTGSAATNILTATLEVAKWPVEEMVDVEGGFYHVRGKKADGTVWAWGKNSTDGEAGINSISSNQLTPVQSQNGSSITDVAKIGIGMGYHTFARRASGLIYSWGKNDAGQLSNGLSGASNPLPSSTSSYYPVHVSNGYQHSCYVNYNGSVYVSGSNTYGQLGDGTNTPASTFKGIAIYDAKIASAGVFHSAVLRADGTVWCFGQGTNYELGTGTNANSLVPVQVLRAAATPLTNIIDVVAGYRYTMALDADGKIWTWGLNTNGQTGQGLSTGYTTYAKKVDSSYYQKISAGLSHAAAIDRNGDVYTWGQATSGRLGNGTISGDILSPTNVSNSTPIDGQVIDVTCTAEGTTVLLANGNIYGVGYGSYGQMGNNTTTINNPNWTPIQKTYYPQVSISGSSDAYESGADAAFTITRSLQVSGVLKTTGVVSVTVDPNNGVAKEGIDISTLDQPIVIPAGSVNAVFTVDAIDDLIDEDNESLSVSVEAGSFYIPGSSPSATRNVIDNDTAQVDMILVSTPVSSESGGYVTFSIRLLTQPTSNVSIQFNSSDTSEGVPWPSNPVTKTFTPANWNSYQTLYVDGRDDDVVDGNVNYTLQVGTPSGDPKYVGLGNLPDWGLVNNDNDVADFIVSSISNNTTEGGVTATFSIRLTSEPTANVTIPISSDNIDEGTVSTSALVFNNSNWSTPQVVTVTGVNDDFDDDDVPYSIKTGKATGAAEYAGKNPVDVSLSNLDNDIAGVLIGALSDDTREDGSTGQFTYVLKTKPYNDVTMTLASMNTNEVTVSTGSLTFTSANWNVPQVITLTGVDDFRADGDQLVNIKTYAATSADSKYNGFNPADVSVYNLDDDTVGTTFSKLILNTTEGGVTDSYSVVLNTEPVGGSVTVTISPASGVTANLGALVFTSVNWSTPQFITVTAVNDSIDEASPETVFVNHSFSGADYGAISQPVSVNVTDNDIAGLVFDPVPFTLVTVEGGSSVSYLVSLATQPTDSMDVTVSASAELRIVDGIPDIVLSFDPDNWSEPQRIDIYAFDDSIIDGNLTGNLTHTFSNTSDTFYSPLVIVSDPVSVVDNDTAEVHFSKASVITGESALNDSFLVTLNSQPTANVTVTFSSSNTAEATVPVSVILTSANWNTGLSVTVTGVNDNIDDGDQAYTIVTNATSTDTNYNINPVDITGTNLDNDTAAVTIGGGSVTVTEGGATDTYTVVLATQPTSNVTISVSAITQVTTNQSTLTFTSVNWATPQIVTVTAINDNDIEGAHLGSIVHSASGGGYSGVSIAGVSPSITDNDTAGAIVSAISGPTTEAGGTATFTIVLTAKPTANVSIGLNSTDTTECTVASPVVFTVFDWNVPKVVTVTGVDDSIIDPGAGSTIQTLAAVSSDANFNGYNAADVVVLNTNNDSAGVIITQSGGNTNVAEGGVTDDYTIVLTAEPAFDVTILVTPVVVPDAQLTTSLPSVTFTNSNWMTPQTITVGAIEDAIAEAAKQRIINHSISTSDTNYGALGAPSSVTVNVADNDQPGILITQSGGSTNVVEDVPEINGDTIQVKLLADPGVDITVTLVDTNTELIFSPSTLTFTTGNYSVNQTVYVSGRSDADVDPGAATLSFTCSGGSYGAVTDSISVNVTDSDTPGITLTQSGGSTDLSEANIGATDNYTVVLASPPGGSITVTLSGNGQATALSTIGSSAVLNFDNANWYVPQGVTVTVVNDSIDETNIHAGIITHTPAAYTGAVVVPLNINITDNDTAGVSISKSSVAVTEGGATDTYDVVLLSAPTQDVTITASTSQVNVTALAVFNSGNWNVVQPIVVTAINDLIDESSPHSGNIAYTASSSDSYYNGITINAVSASVTDNDTAAVTVTSPLANVNETGTTTTLTVVLASQPIADVSISIASSDLTEGTVSPTSLLFTSANWNTVRTITVTGVNDFVVDGNVSFNVQIASPVSSDPQYAAISASVQSLSNIDNDSLGINVLESGGSTLVSEEGPTSDTIQVSLNSQPTGAVAVTVSHISSQITIAGSSSTILNFTTANWNVSQSVTVAAVNDAFAEANPHNALISLTATGADYGSVTNSLNALVTDNDQASFALSRLGGLVTTEAAAPDTVTVALGTAPSASVTVTVSSSDTTEGVISSATTLTFTIVNWMTPQTVTVTGVDDFLDDGNIPYSINLSAASTDVVYAGVTGSVAVSNTDNDTSGIFVTPQSGLTTTESGGSSIFIVKLNAQPAGNVVLNVASSAVAEGVASPATLTFTSTDWNYPQIVTVTGQDDAYADGSVAYNVAVSVDQPLTLDSIYDVLTSINVSCSNVDNDIRGVTILETGGNTAVNEDGDVTDTYTLVLNSRPTTDVTITLTSQSGETVASPASLVFNSTNWNTPQATTITAIDDNIEEESVPHSDIMLHSASGGGYNGVLINSVSITVTDNDSADLVLSTVSGLVVTEDGLTSDTFTIKLNSEPSSLVIVNISVADNTEATVTPAVITFSPSATAASTGHWDFEQTITVDGVNDNIVDGSIAYNINISTISGDSLYTGLAAVVSSTTTDDDAVGIAVSETTLGVQESGTNATYSISLESEPTNDVTIAISSADTGEVSVDLSSITFNAFNWNIPRFIKVTGVNDSIDDGNQVVTVVNQDATSLDLLYNGLNPGDVLVTNADDDTASVIIAQTGGFTSVAESGITDTYTVVLGTEPTVNVTVNILPNSQLLCSVPSLLFTSTNWNTPQVVTVSALNDSIDEGPEVDQVLHTASGGEYSAISISAVDVNIADDDVAGVLVTPTDGLFTSENGDSATFTVELLSQPLDDVTIAISSNDLGEGTVSPSSLTFTASDWNIQQTVTVTGVNDGSDDDDQAYLVLLANANSADGNYNNLDVSDVSLINLDNDGAAVSVSKTNLIISEAGSSDNYTIVLDTEPSADVTITLSADVNNVTLSSTVLLFTVANYATPQQITVSAVNDDIAEGAHSVVISHTATGGDYTGIPVSTVSANIADNDTAGVSVSRTSGLATSEAGPGSDTFTVVLTSKPTSSVTINITSLNPGEATPSPASVTFTTVNWNTPRTITVTGVNDAIADGNAAFTIDLAAAISDDPFYGGSTPIDPPNVTGVNTDDEVAGITVTPTSGLTTTESGGTAVFTVRLNTQPLSDVVIPVSSNLPSEGTVAISSLTFTSVNWNTAQTVTVTGADDDIDDPNGSFLIVLGVAVSTDATYGTPANLDATDVSVTNLDDDTAGFIIIPNSGLITSESGSTAQFTVQLNSEPTADVSFDLSSLDPTEGLVDTATVTFTNLTWNIPQIITITGQDDGGFDGNVAYSIQTNNVVSADGNYSVLNPDDVSVTNQDNDTPGVNINVSGGSTDVSEAGLTSDTFTIVLTTTPSSAVTINLSSTLAQVSINPAVVSFTTGNWSTPQTVTITAVQDAIAEGLHSDLISVDAVSSDGDYNLNDITSALNVNITDNDVAAITVSPSSGLVTSESGGTAQFSVVLATQPTASVTIPVSTGDSSEGSIAISSLLFTTGNWFVPQYVTVTGVEDLISDGPVVYTIVLSPPTSTDLQYAAINPSDVSLTNSDNDGPNVLFTATGGSNLVIEGGVSDTYEVVLNTAPTANVIIAATAGSQTTVSPANRTFTSANWNVPQIFTVTAINDSIAEGNHFGAITHTASSVSDVNYNGLALSPVSFMITDNDSVGVLVSPVSGLITNETGATDSFTVRLNSQPTANVTLTVASSDTTEGTVSTSLLTFTSVTWLTPQTVTVTGVNDGLTDGNIGYQILTGVTISTDPLYDGLAVSNVSATNIDDDQPALLITAVDNTADEGNAGNTASYQVRLSTAPSSSVDLAISVDADGILLTASTLSFTVGNWSSTQLIEVAAFNDSIAEGMHSATISVAPSGDGVYAALPVLTIDAGILDNDAAGVLVSAVSGLITNEIGGTDSYELVLSSQPIADVSITVTSSDPSQITVPGSAFVFSSVTWNVPQTVLLTGVDTNNTDDGDVAVTIINSAVSSTDPNYSGMSVDDVSAVNESVNNEPTLNAVVTQSITEDAPSQLVILTGISVGQTGESQTLAITATSSNTALIPNPVVVNNGDGTADLTYTPVLNQFGNGTIITVVVQDNGPTGGNDDNSISRSFTINVASSNDLPVISVSSIFHISTTVAMVANTGTTNPITNTNLSAVDVEDLDSTLVYTLVLQPGQGSVRNNFTAAVISPGGTWTQNDIDLGYIEYVHNGLPGGVTDGFAFTVTDSQSGISSNVFQIYVDRQAPSVSLSGADLSYTENAGAVPIDSAAIISAGNIDPFNNGSLLVEWTTGQTANDNLVLSGGITVDINGIVTLPGSIIIGSVDTILDGEDGSDLLINFVSTTPTSANITSLIRNIAYLNDSENPSTTLRTVRMTLDDGFLSSGPASRNIAMQAQNDPPVIGGSTFGTILNVPLNSFLPVSDPDGTITSIVVTSQPSLGLITIINPATGSFLFQPTLDQSGPTNFDIDVTDNLGITVSGTMNIQITDVNSVHPRVISDPPMFALDGDTLVYTPILQAGSYTGNLTFQLLDKPSGLSDPNIFGTISWNLTGLGGQVLRFSYFISDDGSNEVGIQPVMIYVLPAPGGGG